MGINEAFREAILRANEQVSGAADSIEKEFERKIEEFRRAHENLLETHVLLEFSVPPEVVPHPGPGPGTMTIYRHNLALVPREMKDEPKTFLEWGEWEYKNFQPTVKTVILSHKFQVDHVR